MKLAVHNGEVKPVEVEDGEVEPLDDCPHPDDAPEFWHYCPHCGTEL